MKPVRRLTLRKETLVELTTGELSRMAGASDEAGCRPTAEGLTCLRQTLTMCPDFYCTGTC